jgi:alpha(1,3/1,4) fucosyltransferase
MSKAAKKTVKVNFKYFWETFNPENNFFTNLLRKNYNVIVSDNPDYMFYSVFPEVKETVDLSKKGDFIKSISPKLYTFLRKTYSKINLAFSPKKFLLPKGNFVKVFCGAEHVKPNMEECDWAFSPHFEESINSSRHMRIPAYMLSDYMLRDFGSPSQRKKINFNKIKKEKTKFCNFIYSQDVPERNNFFKELSKYKKIDSPGRCMNNMPPIGSYTDSKKSRLSVSWVKEKLNFLKPYKFTIAFENASKPGWVTEKLTQPLLVNSIPIYFGHPEVKRDFNTKSFLNYHDFNDMKSFIEHIIKVDKDDKLYKQYFEQPIYSNKEAYEFSRTDRIEKRLIEIIESKK